MIGKLFGFGAKTASNNSNSNPQRSSQSKAHQPKRNTRAQQSGNKIKAKSNHKKGGNRRHKPAPKKAPVANWSLDQFPVLEVEGKSRFHDLDLPVEVMHAIADLGFEYCSPIQARALPYALNGQDVVGKAQTGTGKTAAFLLAIIDDLIKHPLEQERFAGEARALIVAPTRELVIQIAEDAKLLTKYTDLSVQTLVGGMDYGKQQRRLQDQLVDIMVATPGRLLDFCGNKDVYLDQVEVLVIDEADRMLDMGFAQPIAEIVEWLPAKRQTLLLSATMPASIKQLSLQYQHEPIDIDVESARGDGLADGLPAHLQQAFYRVAPQGKLQALRALLLASNAERVLVFCNTRDTARTLQAQLHEMGFAALALHGEQDQQEREATLVRFANFSCRILVASDVAARGLDIKELPLVVNYDVAGDVDVHTHRIGRTGRAGADGTAISLCTERDAERVRHIAERFDLRIEWQALPVVENATEPPSPAFRTLSIAAGKQDKLRAGDILGALTGDAGLPGSAVGKIDVFPTRSYVAVTRGDYPKALQRLRDGKIKGRSYRVRGLR